MPGIYIHIPFCRKACHYCNFHFSVSERNKDRLLSSLLKEIDIQKEYLSPFTGKTSKNKILTDTLYFGGGTPSILRVSELMLIINKINEYFELKPGAEITLEANPDDLSADYLRELSMTPVNRLSIGIQSFQDKDLEYLNRSHSSKQAIQSIENAYKAGFQNITADLIYGIPTLNNTKWQENLLTLINLGVPHISAYCLTVEPKTALNVFIKQGQLENPDDEKASGQFELMMDMLDNYGYEHYEISNFAKPGFFSKHNTSYWQNKPYLGIGPSAHSYNLSSRQWNIPNTTKYIENILNKKVIPYEKETISSHSAYNEYIMTSLRTQWGCSKDEISKRFGKMFLDHFENEILNPIYNGYLYEKGNHVVLTQKGKLYADKIASDLFILLDQ